MRSPRFTLIALIGMVCASGTLAQTWPDYYLTNGTHYTSYGVEDYDPATARNLYIEPTAILYASSNELDNIYDGNQVYLNGGTVHASAIDESDFTWNSGDLYLDGGTHSSVYGFDHGEGQNLYMQSTATLDVVRVGYYGSNNKLNITGGGTVDASAVDIGRYYAGELNVADTGSSLQCGQITMGSGSFGNLLSVNNGGHLSSSGLSMEGYSKGYNQAEVTGAGSQWDTGSMSIGTVQSKYNALTISEGARVNSGTTVIGNGSAANYNAVTASGSETIWNNTGDLSIGVSSGENSLEISGGAVVSNANAHISVQSGYSSYNNSVSVHGEGSRWVNTGSVELGAPTLPSSGSQGGNRIDIADGGEVVAEGGLTINQIFSYPASQNTLNLKDGGRLVVGSDFDASQAGFNYESGSTLTVAGILTGLPVLEAGRRLEALDVLGDLTVNGTFALGNSPADSIVQGGLTLSAEGTLEMEIGGMNLGTEYDRLTVTGAADLDGTLDIAFLDGFSPTYGAVFDLFNWDSGVSGEFSSINAPTLSGDLYWDSTNLYTTGQLMVVPEPGVATLMAVFGGCMLFIRRLRM